MLLCNVSITGKEGLKNISIQNGKILSVYPSELSGVNSETDPSIIFNEAIAFPGLINSHDHLDFNLFPSLRNNIYTNYTEWGRDIHKKNKTEINKVLLVPQQLRTQWGIYKNLINGFTTVVNHGARLKIDETLITVFQKTHSLHSPGFEKNWKWKINRPFKNKWPFTIHVGEGTDNISRLEIDELIEYNFFNKDLIAVHGVAMNEQQAENFRALIWCPDSNYFLLDKTAAINKLKNKTKIIFGSDSTLTSHWNIWEHIRLARKEKLLTDMELFETLTSKPATVWGLQNTGEIEKSGQADIVIAKRKKNLHNFDAFFATSPEDILLIMHKGEIRLFDAELKKQIAASGIPLNNFSMVNINQTRKYVQGGLPELIKEIKKYYPEACLPISIS